MKIIDTYEEIKKLESSMRLNTTVFLEEWKRYIANISPLLVEKLIQDSNNYNLKKEVIPVIEQAFSEEDILRQVHENFLEVTKDLSKKVENNLKYQLDIDIIFYLGLCNGAGWATNIGNRKVILLGIEKIIELKWYNTKSMIALIYHEIGHIWHDHILENSPQLDTQWEHSLWQLYREGMAMYCEQLLYNDHSFYHQDTNGWLIWCKENKKQLIKEYKLRLDKNESTQEFFGDWHSYKGHSDIGYYIGCEFVKWLIAKYSIVESCHMDMKSMLYELEEYMMAE